MGATLNNSTHEEWAKLNVQTALGQTLALEIGNTIFEASNKKLDCEDEWSVILASCGLWVQVKESGSTLAPVKCTCCHSGPDIPEWSWFQVRLGSS